MRARMIIIALASTSFLAFGSAAYADHGHGRGGSSGGTVTASKGGIAVGSITQSSTVNVSHSGAFVSVNQSVNIGNSLGF
jgi:hypothetical protein